MIRFALLLAALAQVEPLPPPAAPAVALPPDDVEPEPPVAPPPVVKPAPGPCTAPFSFDHKSPPLQRALLKKLWGAGLDRYITKGQLGVALVDLTTKGKQLYAGVNDDKM